MLRPDGVRPLRYRASMNRKLARTVRLLPSSLNTQHILNTSSHEMLHIKNRAQHSNNKTGPSIADVRIFADQVRHYVAAVRATAERAAQFVHQAATQRVAHGRKADACAQ